MPSWLNQELHPRDGDKVVFNNLTGVLNARLTDPESPCSIVVDGKEVIKLLFGQIKHVFFYDMETMAWRLKFNDWDYHVNQYFKSHSIEYCE